MALDRLAPRAARTASPSGQDLMNSSSVAVDEVPPTSYRILLVEDDPGDAILVDQALDAAASDDFAIVREDRLEGALARLVRHPFDCVLLDLWLPDSGGIETLTRLVRHSPDVPVVVLTGLSDDAAMHAAVRQGAQDYLNKAELEGRLLWRTIRYAKDRKRTELEYQFQATHDPLTGLANRQGFMDRLELALSKLDRDPGYVGLLFLDLDGFKLINDSLGHAAGDTLLRSFAERLQQEVRLPDIVGRLGGDEFLVLLDRVSSPFAVLNIADRIQQCLHTPFQFDDQEVWVGASIGMSLSKDSETRAADLLREADAALYRAKSRGRSRNELFDVRLQSAAEDRLRLKADLHTALAEDQLVVHYQPIVDLTSGDLYGSEALVRWQRDGLLVMPGSFIGFAEETGLILPIGDRVFEIACQRAAALQHDGTQGRLLTVNVSGRQLASPTFAASLSRTLDHWGADPATIGLEITETALMFDEEQLLNRLGHIKSLGLKLLIDDFGTGFSSLTYLHRYPFDAIKIDTSFVHGLFAGDNASSAITSAVIQLGRSLGMEVIAEGVETETQAQRLLSLGCRLAQGFHLGRPVPDLGVVPRADLPAPTRSTP